MWLYLPNFPKYFGKNWDTLRPNLQKLSLASGWGFLQHEHNSRQLVWVGCEALPQDKESRTLSSIVWLLPLQDHTKPGNFFASWYPSNQWLGSQYVTGFLQACIGQSFLHSNMEQVCTSSVSWKWWKPYNLTKITQSHHESGNLQLRLKTDLLHYLTTQDIDKTVFLLICLSGLGE